MCEYFYCKKGSGVSAVNVKCMLGNRSPVNAQDTHPTV